MEASRQYLNQRWFIILDEKVFFLENPFEYVSSHLVAILVRHNKDFSAVLSIHLEYNKVIFIKKAYISINQSINQNVSRYTTKGSTFK